MIGDDFVTKASGFLLNGEAASSSSRTDDFFMRKHYEVKTYHGSSLELNRSVISRVHNAFV